MNGLPFPSAMFSMAPLDDFRVKQRSQFDVLPVETVFVLFTEYDMAPTEYVKVDDFTAERMHDGLSICVEGTSTMVEVRND